MILSVLFRILPFIQNPSVAKYSFVSGKMYTLLVPSRICKAYALKALGTKVILSRGDKGKVFNLTLMNKLMIIITPRVSESGLFQTSARVQHNTIETLARLGYRRRI